MRRIYAIFIFFIIFLQYLSSQNISKNVLLLNSYNQGFPWTDRVTGSLITNLSRGKYKINLVIEYLDTKRIKPDSFYFSNAKALFEKKYDKNKFDVIISSDDDAFYFLLKYRDQLFPNTPVVACGLGSKNENLIKRANLFFGIYDDYKEEESFYNSFEILPQAKNVVFIADQTTTGKSSLEGMREMISLKKNINPVFISDGTIDDIIIKINQMPDNTIVYPLVFNYDKSGKFYSHSEFTTILSKSIKFPIIAISEEQIGYGAIGGIVNSGLQHGIVTSNIALRLLNGESINSLNYSKDSLSIPIFDYKYLDYFNVKESSLPTGSLIINKPVTFYEQYKTVILFISSVFIILIAIIIIISVNIIKRKQAEVNLRKLSRAVEQSPVSIVITNTKGIMDYVNPKYCEVTGYTYEESVGQKASMLKSGLTTIEKYDCLWKTISNGEEWRGEIYNKKKNGDLFWESISISPVINTAGKIIYYVAVKEDITEQKNNENKLRDSKEKLEATLKELKLTQNQVIQQERLRSIGQMASGIAHDINNSLMPILGYSDLLLFKKNLEPELEKKISSIRTASLDIKRTIERMKDFYKPRIENEEFNSVNLNTIIKSAVEFTQHRWKDMAESRGIVITVFTDLERDLPFIKGNESELREALTNLILNASDAMPAGGKLTVKSKAVESEVFLELSDTGIGMDEQTLSHCFDPFYTTKGMRGSGLGLSMVYGIIQRHNGKIELSSERGKGTKIKLVFQKDISPNTGITEKITSLIKPLKILCIDDSEDARELVESILKNDQHKIILSNSGEAGLDEFFNSLNNHEPYDIVITDLGMPYMDGKSVSEAIKSKSPNTPVILMTGWGAFLEPGSIKSVDYILKKPITVLELNEALRYVLKK